MSGIGGRAGAQELDYLPQHAVEANDVAAGDPGPEPKSVLATADTLRHASEVAIEEAKGLRHRDCGRIRNRWAQLRSLSVLLLLA